MGLVKENVNFKRGQDSKRSLDAGLNSNHLEKEYSSLFKSLNIQAAGVIAKDKWERIFIESCKIFGQELSEIFFSKVNEEGLILSGYVYFDDWKDWMQMLEKYYGGIDNFHQLSNKEKFICNRLFKKR